MIAFFEQRTGCEGCDILANTVTTDDKTSVPTIKLEITAGQMSTTHFSITLTLRFRSEMLTSSTQEDKKKLGHKSVHIRHQQTKW
jgi:hypothetical protein